MRMLRYVDYDCLTCGSADTRFVYYDTEAMKPDDEEQHCEEAITNTEDVCELPCGATCGEVLVPRAMNGIGYMKTIVKGSSDYNERERERLEKRQDDHWRRAGRDEAIDRERALFKKMGSEGAGGVR